MNQPDPTSKVNREMMDYLFENKEGIGSEIYNKLAKLIAKKEEVKEKPKHKFFKVRYVLVETITIAKNSGDDSDDESHERRQNMTSMFHTKTYNKILQAPITPRAYATRRSDNGIVAMSSLASSSMTLSSLTVRVA